MKPESELFVSPGRIFSEMAGPKDIFMKRIGLKVQRRDFSKEEIDEAMIRRLKFWYWQAVAPEVLILIKNPGNKRFGQIGSVSGYYKGKVSARFGHGPIAVFDEEEISVIEKTKICPQAEIEVEFSEGDRFHKDKLIGYKENNNKSDGPQGWYLVQIGHTIKQYTDSGNYKMSLAEEKAGELTV